MNLICTLYIAGFPLTLSGLQYHILEIIPSQKYHNISSFLTDTDL